LAGNTWTGGNAEVIKFIKIKTKTMPADQIQYSEKYFDDKFEYRYNVTAPAQ